tara:strand:- start:175 stop:351 length:177 start_codon:yes stop_codon:yes gene_type:complete
MQMLVEVDQRFMFIVMVALVVVVEVPVVLEPRHQMDRDLKEIPEEAVMIIFGQVFHPL